MLSIFIKAPSNAFAAVLNEPLFYRCYLTFGVTLRYILTLYFKVIHIHPYSTMLSLANAYVF